MFKVLKAFPYSADGVSVVDLPEGADGMEIRQDLRAGLLAEGYIEATAGKAAHDPGAVEIAEGWAELDEAAQLALASAITGKNIKAKASAVKAIEAEVARRAAAA